MLGYRYRESNLFSRDSERGGWNGCQTNWW